MSKRVVLCNGVFDILHIGHLWHFQAARLHGDWLVVSITNDLFVNKGPGRPVFTDQQRREMVGSLTCVDRTILVSSSLEALELVEPQVFAKGKDYKGKILQEDLDYCKANNIEIVFTDEPTYSSTELLRHYDRLG